MTRPPQHPSDQASAVKNFDGAGIGGFGGLELPGIDNCRLAEGYGVASVAVDCPDELEQAVRVATVAGGPRLIEVRVAPGIWSD